MAAMIWDTEAQAFTEAQTPMVYDTENQAWRETTGLVWDEQNQAWVEKWNPKKSRITLVEKQIGATGIGTWTSNNGHLTCITPYVNSWRERGGQPDLLCTGLSINLSLYKTLYIDFRIGSKGQQVGSGNIPFYFSDANNTLGEWQFNSKPTGTMTIDISSIVGTAVTFRAIGSGTFINETLDTNSDVMRINELWLE